MARTRIGVPGSAVVPPGPSPVDLHVHTSRSDGILEPTVLVVAARAAGVTTLAITDHDNLAATRELLATDGALPTDLELLAGVEINTAAGGRPAAWR